MMSTTTTISTTTTTLPLRPKYAASMLLLLTYAMRSSLAAVQDMPDFGKPKVCTHLRCPRGHSAVQKPLPRFESAGCNAVGGGGAMTMFSPGSSESDGPVSGCCDRWHACYQICGSNRQQCDDAFKKCGEDACARIVNDDDAKKKCDTKMSVSAMMLQVGDCRQYDVAQRNACQCVGSHRVGEYRKEVLRSFYMKYAPSALDEERVKMLAEKADTREKMAGLFQKLVAKYPKCIRKVKDPKEAYMERMMKRAEQEKKKASINEGSDTGDDSDETQEL